MEWLGLSAVLGLTLALLGFLLVRAQAHIRLLESRFKHILDPDAEVKRLEGLRLTLEQDIQQQHMKAANDKARLDQDLRKQRDKGERLIAVELAKRVDERNALEIEIEKRRENWDRQFKEAMLAFEELNKHLEEADAEVEMQSFGLYKPRFTFATVDGYKERLKEVRNQQRIMVKDKLAAVCTTTWTVSGSKAEGEKMTVRQLKLMLRAFNGECDAAVASATWKNIVPLKERIAKSLDAINKLGEVNYCSITSGYAALKREELELAYDHAEKIQQEKEEKRLLQEQRREEEKANKELEAARDDAEREEVKYADALERARSEVSVANQRERSDLDSKIAKLEALLAKAQERKARAISQAELTRSGHVYILSNEGAFGQNVFKIGMTRRLDPMDRVAELGGAAVPFHFDVHAIIYSEDAPTLESSIHAALEPHRVNLVNGRKEFFRVPIEKVVDLVTTHHGKIAFSQLAEASDFRKTLAIRAEREAMVAGKQAHESAVRQVDQMRARFEELKKKTA